MAQALKDSFLDLERHRQLLEANVETLRKSLQHWQTWSAEYEGLKEEIVALESPTRAQLVAIGKSYEGELVTQKEVEDILGVKVSRSSDQVINILDRRIDYVTQNIKTVEKQLQTEEEKLERVSIVGRPEVRNEEGLPLMEIFEELDEDGNVIEGRVEAHGSNRGLLEEVLKKAGIKDLPESSKAANETNLTTTGDVTDKEDAKPRDIMENKPSQPRKKTVSFAPELDIQETQKHDDNFGKKGVDFQGDKKSVPPPGESKTAKRVQAIVNMSKELDDGFDQPPVIPENESQEDAALRRDMLAYGMNEIGAVVAELDLEEGTDFSDDDYDDDESSMSDDEDEHGRSTRQVVDDDIRKRMMELEKKLGVRMMENVGPNHLVKSSDESSNSVVVKNEGTPREMAPPTLSRTSSSGEKKGVRFADELDISPAPEPGVPEPKKSKLPTRPPISDIIERAAPEENASRQVETPQKVSRFKAGRSVGVTKTATRFLPPKFTPPSRTRQVPSGPENATLANKIVERDVTPGDVGEPDEFDPALLQQEVATEYYKQRNKRIQAQGGFKGPEEEEERTGRVEFTEEEGGPKKVSRFMAARLAKGM